MFRSMLFLFVTTISLWPPRLADADPSTGEPEVETVQDPPCLGEDGNPIDCNAPADDPDAGSSLDPSGNTGTSAPH